MRRNLNGLLLFVFLTTALTAIASESPPPPPPPPPPLEETGSIDSPTSGEWSIKGQNSLLDKSTGHVRHPMVSFFVGVPFGVSYGYGYGYTGYYGVFNFGLGARFYLPIVAEGFLPMLNDSFGIEFGADTIFVVGGYGYGLGFALTIPAAEARWNFHVFPKLEAYAKLGLGLGLFFNSGYVNPYPVIIANVGVLFKINNVLSLRAEIGSPAVKIGLGLAF